MRLLLLLWLTLSMPALAECAARSGDKTTPLLELYTSEGCSSCPPADKWLSSLKGTSKVVPLAFHVDYWDYIGWKDRFASPKYSARQRQAAGFNGSAFVYTPQVMLNGREFRDWRNPANYEKVTRAARRAADVKLSLALIETSPNQLQALAQTANSKDADIYVAIYENNLVSRIDAGENSGRELRHDFVVREWLGPYRFEHNGNWRHTIPVDGWQNRDAGAVLFVQQRRGGEVLQALALEFCP